MTGVRAAVHHGPRAAWILVMGTGVEVDRGEAVGLRISAVAALALAAVRIVWGLAAGCTACRPSSTSRADRPNADP